MTIELIETRFFAFENDFVGSLKCIPMIVRYKLDSCRIKLQLSDWVRLSFQEKDELARMPCYTDMEIETYGRYVHALAWKYTGAYPSALAQVRDSWTNPGAVPDEVQEKALEWECAEISLQEWGRLDVLERFALIKLSRSGHEGKNFPRACAEFGLVKMAC